jgi:ribosomal protein S18 acetylase RimI-like enzyme
MFKKEIKIMIRLELITNENITFATRIQNEIFPEYNGLNNYLDSLKNDSNIHFFLVYEGDTCIGTTGIYAYKNDDKNAWIGFFGLKGKYRYQGIGKDVLALTEDYARENNYKFIRLFTDKLNNDPVINFYKKNGYTFEDYNSNLEDKKNDFLVVIGSKSLTGEEVEPWNNKFLNISKQALKQIYD